ncbi:BAG domain-containing protein [Colletotrichum salicis]|uniref:BAG domain-containing protein n=1 Tax=Colletotrichum salicis TaxID=1209931 RepID=A0A135UIN8_9PEZI|nr:BAG domain-containing protein [Colletotrichum salicis]
MGNELTSAPGMNGMDQGPACSLSLRVSFVCREMSYLSICKHQAILNQASCPPRRSIALQETISTLREVFILNLTPRSLLVNYPLKDSEELRIAKKKDPLAPSLGSANDTGSSLGAQPPVIRCPLRTARFSLEPPLHIHFHASPPHAILRNLLLRPLTSRRATFDTPPQSLTHPYSVLDARRIPARRPHHRLFIRRRPPPKGDSALPSFQSCFYSLTKANEPPPASLTQNGLIIEPRESENSRRGHPHGTQHPRSTFTPSATIRITAVAFDLASLHLVSPPPPPLLIHFFLSPGSASLALRTAYSRQGGFQSASSGIFWCPPKHHSTIAHPLQVYLDKSIAGLAKAIANYSGYISDTTGIDPNLVLYSTIGCILLAVPFTMSRYGWSTNREQISPYGSTLSGVPNVTDEDFSYITTEDLQSTSLGGPVPTRSYAHNPRSRGSVPEDDILLIKNKGITYPAHFPAYAIGDGKLRVRDVRDRVSVLLELSERRGRRVKLLYKGRQLKEPAAPVRDYGVKNNSEVMVVLPESDVDAESSDDSDEEMVVVAGDGGSAVGSTGGTDDGKKRRGKKKGRKSKKRSSNTSPRDSASNLGVPGQDRQSSPSPSKANGAHAKLDAIAAKFEADLRQPCEDYIASPPTDPKKREEEHRKLSETTMQHVLLKLDEVETEGDQEARMKRKALVQTVQELLKRLDAKLKA